MFRPNRDLRYFEAVHGQRGMHVIEKNFLGYNGPVRAISPQYIGTLSDTELADIAAESYAACSTNLVN